MITGTFIIEYFGNKAWYVFGGFKRCQYAASQLGMTGVAASQLGMTGVADLEFGLSAKTKVIISISSLAALLLVAGFFMTRQGEEAIKVDELDEPLILKHFWSTKREFKVSYKSVGKYAEGNLFKLDSKKSAKKMSVEFGAELTQEFMLVNRSNDQIFRFTLSGIEGAFKYTGVRGKDVITAELSKPVLVRRTKAGEVVGIWFEDGVGDDVKNIIRDLFSSVQLVFGVPKGEFYTWSVREKDQVGSYLAEYKIPAFDQDGKVTIEKIKNKYFKNRKEDEATVSTASGRQKVVFELERGFAVDTDSRFSYVTKLVGRTIAEWTTEVKLTFVDDEVIKSGEGRGEVSLKLQVEAPEAPTSWESEARLDRKIQTGTWKDSKIEDVLKHLDEIDNEGKEFSTADKGRLVNKLYAYVYLYPDKARELAEQLLEADGQSMAFLFILGALSQVGHEEAQKAMLYVAESSGSSDEKMRKLIPSIAFVKEPIDEAEKFLTDMSESEPKESRRDQAYLGLGIMADSLKDHSDERSDRIVKRLYQKLDSSTDETSQVTLLGAIGNAAPESAVEYAPKYTGAKSEVVRAAAYQSVREVTTPKANEILLTGLKEEKERHVRGEIADSFSYAERDPEVYRKLCQIYKSEKAPAVRVELLQAVWKMRAIYPEAMTTIRWSSENDASEEVKRVARKMVLGS